jgi:carotenoid cleavage dioxygenase-like enzyme
MFNLRSFQFGQNYFFENGSVKLSHPTFHISTFFTFLFTGNVPEWLEGSLYRVGPGIFQRGTLCYNHPFDMTSVLVIVNRNDHDLQKLQIHPKLYFYCRL